MRYTPLLQEKGRGSVVMGIEDTYTALLHELALTAMGSVSGYCCKLSMLSSVSGSCEISLHNITHMFHISSLRSLLVDQW